MELSFTIELNSRCEGAETLIVSCKVTPIKDGYGTGDSPTLCDVEDVKISTEDGEVVDIESREDFAKITDKAIELAFEMELEKGEW